MKYLKRFNETKASVIENEIDGHIVKVTAAYPSNVSGGVQIDHLTVTVNGEEEYEFEVASLISGDIFVYPKFEGGDFYEHFDLVEDSNIENEELSSFLAQNDEDCIGEITEIDGFELEITDFSHMGGVEEGYIQTEIDDEEYSFFIVQDATGPHTEIRIEFDSSDDEEKAKKNGIELTEELESWLYEEYDRICNEERQPFLGGD